jgi:hypothetical protein
MKYYLPLLVVAAILAFSWDAQVKNQTVDAKPKPVTTAVHENVPDDNKNLLQYCLNTVDSSYDSVVEAATYQVNGKSFINTKSGEYYLRVKQQGMEECRLRFGR